MDDHQTQLAKALDKQNQAVLLMNVSGEALLNTVETVVRRIHSSNQFDSPFQIIYRKNLKTWRKKQVIIVSHLTL